MTCFYGGARTDLFVEGGKSTSYTIAQHGGDGNSWSITDKTTHAVDVIYNVEKLQLSDKTIDISTLDRSGTPLLPSSAQMATTISPPRTAPTR